MNTKENIENVGLHLVIISASRSTDIPAFYSDWLISRIQEGFVMWKNPVKKVAL